MISKRFFLLKNEVPPNSQGQKLDYLLFKDFLKFKCELYLKQELTPNTIQGHCFLLHIIDLPFQLVDGQLSLPLEIIYYVVFVVENKAHFVLECPLLEISFHHYLTMLQY